MGGVSFWLVGAAFCVAVTNSTGVGSELYPLNLLNIFFLFYLTKNIGTVSFFHAESAFCIYGTNI